MRPPPLWLIFSITATGIMSNPMIGASVPEILDHFDKPASAAGLLVAAGPAPSIVLAPLMGLLTDRLGRRRVLVPCLVLFGASGMAAGLAPTFGLLLVGRLIQGIGSAGLMAMSWVLIGDFWTGEQRARYIGYNTAVLTGCVAVYPGLGGVITELVGWRWVFAPYGAALITATLIYRRLDAATGDRSVRVRDQLARAAKAVRDPVVLGACLSMFVLFVVIFGLFLTTMPLLLEDRFGMGPAARGLVLTVPAISSTLGSLVVSRVRRSLGTARLLVSGFAALAVSYFVIGVSSLLLLLIAASIVYGWVEGVVIPTLLDLVTGGAPAESRAAVMSAQVTFTRTGQTTGPLLAGLALTSLDEGTLFVIGAAVVGLAAFGQLAYASDASAPSDA